MAPTKNENSMILRLKGIRDDEKRGDKVRKLADYIVRVVRHISAKEWDNAYKILIDQERLKNFNYHLKMNHKEVKTKSDAEIDAVASNFFHFHEERKLQFQNVYIPEKGKSPLEWKSPSNDDFLAQRILPLMLEEWLHMFQHMKGGFISNHTYEFVKSSSDEFKKHKGESDWDPNEVDIYAVYRELGWSKILPAFEKRYKGRHAFEKYMKSKDAKKKAAKKKK